MDAVTAWPMNSIQADKMGRSLLPAGGDSFMSVSWAWSFMRFYGEKGGGHVPQMLEFSIIP